MHQIAKLQKKCKIKIKCKKSKIQKKCKIAKKTTDLSLLDALRLHEFPEHVDFGAKFANDFDVCVFVHGWFVDDALRTVCVAQGSQGLAAVYISRRDCWIKTSVKRHVRGIMHNRGRRECHFGITLRINSVIMCLNWLTRSLYKILA